MSLSLPKISLSRKKTIMVTKKKTKKEDIPTINHFPKKCPDCGGWIDFKSNKFGKFYVCKYCRWSCTGEHW